MAFSFGRRHTVCTCTCTDVRRGRPAGSSPSGGSDGLLQLGYLFAETGGESGNFRVAGPRRLDGGPKLFVGQLRGEPQEPARVFDRHLVDAAVSLVIEIDLAVLDLFDELLLPEVFQVPLRLRNGEGPHLSERRAEIR